MNILSVDWDYFFPNLSEFDWGMSERSTAVDDLLWHIRYWDRGIISGEIAHESALPDKQAIEFFWSMVLKNTNDPLIVITESHKDIYHFICSAPERVKVWNFDQHHDCGYGRSMPDDPPNCGNWAIKNWAKIKEYNLIYPPWRNECKEPDPVRKPDNIYFTMPKNMPYFQMVFVCRSSPWTPSWADEDWIYFIRILCSLFPDQYRYGIKLDYVMRPRKFDFEVAKKFRMERSING